MYNALFSKRGLSLDRIRSFCQIAEAKGSVTKAANNNPVRQSLYSRQLGELEEFFGAKLFDRRGKALVITEQGQKLLALAKELLSSLELLADSFQKQPRTVSIGAGDSILNWLILPKLERLKEILPNTRFRFRDLRSNQITQCVQEMDLDLGIVRKTACSPGLKTLKLGSMQYALFAPKPLLKSAGVKNVKFLSELPLVTLEGEGEFRQLLAEVAEAKHISFNIRYTVSSFPLVRNIMENGNVAGILPQVAKADLPPAEYQEMEFPFLRRLDREYVLCFHPRVISLRPFLEKAIYSLTGLWAIGSK